MTTKTRPHVKKASTTATYTAAALAAGLLLTSCSFGSLVPGGGPRKTAGADTAVAGTVTAVEVADARSGSIEVVAGSGPGVTVRRTVHYRGDTVPDPAQRVSGGVLTLTNGNCSGRCSIDYRLEVPASATGRAESSSGRVTVAGVAAADLATSSGSVRADRADRIAGPLKVRTSSGSITAGDLSGPDADARSDSGDVRLGFLRPPAPVTVETSSGEAALKVPAEPQIPYALDVSTSSGSRDITLPGTPSAASRLVVRTASGDIRISAS
ncbi:DUF4097 family beta strand repeat-containing protein [Streptomyces sp. H34-S4]|uniref:DUF4097 family beta strand repeat-containing protein n=1 Tax=Streptomyces sp. H34-S4 TaxID=2996463 RepID=UPI0022710C6D|nr:DUF4097 family beta strand repeat-containing protein [Streptomyces sp. H34-S4]MCY0933368.1 DUF4097 family beta strand repeat-containing protein [Streptomyces sp. H34-S4]